MLSCCWLCLCCVHVATFKAFFLMSFSPCTFGLDAKGLDAKLAFLGMLEVQLENSKVKRACEVH